MRMSLGVEFYPSSNNACNEMTHLVATLIFAAIVFIFLFHNTALWPASSEESQYAAGKLTGDQEPFRGPTDQDTRPIAHQIWSFSPDLHVEDFTLDVQQCEIAFPDLWYEIDRSVAFWQAQLSRDGAVINTSSDLQNDGTFRALIHNNRLRILQTRGIFKSSEPQLAERAVAVWQQIHRALLGASAAGEVLPSIEFSVIVEDIPPALYGNHGTHHAL